MPELPEVETVRRGLTQLVKGSTIQSVDVLYAKMINLPPNDFKKALRGKTIEKIDRRGKYLLIRLSDNLTIVSHLRMEGKYDVEPEEETGGKNRNITFDMTGGGVLVYM